MVPRNPIPLWLGGGFAFGLFGEAPFLLYHSGPVQKTLTGRHREASVFFVLVAGLKGLPCQSANQPKGSIQHLRLESHVTTAFRLSFEANHKEFHRKPTPSDSLNCWLVQSKSPGFRGNEWLRKTQGMVYGTIPSFPVPFWGTAPVFASVSSNGQSSSTGWDSETTSNCRRLSTHRVCQVRVF